jgi:hypothetical protein
MFFLNSPLFWFEFVIYWVVVFLVYYIPGYLALKRLKLTDVLLVPLAITTGMILLAYQGYIFGYLNIRWMTFIYLGILFLIWLKSDFNNFRYKIGLIIRSRINFSKITLIILIIGVLGQISTIWFSGVNYHGTTYYCCGNPNDNFWYGAITQQIINKYPPEAPGLSGVKLTNYHYWSNLIIAETSRISGLQPFWLQFQFNSILLVVLAGWLLIGFSNILNLNSAYKQWLLFFFYFGSDAVYWILLILGKGFDFTMSSLEDGIGFLANMPRAYAIVVFFAALNLLLIWFKRKSKWLTFVLAILFASLVGLKIYVGIFACIGLGFLTIYRLIFYHRTDTLWLTILTGLLAICIYLPVNANAGSFYFIGFWRFENFIVQPALGLLRLEQARQIFAADHKWHRAIPYDILFGIIYIISTFGTKLISLIQTKKTLNKLPIEIHIFFIPGFIICTVLGLFYLQSIGSSNTFNFLVVVFILSSIYTALTLSVYIPKKINFISMTLIIIIVGLTAPRSINKIIINISQSFTTKSFTLSQDITESAEYLRNHTPRESVIATDFYNFPFDKEGPVFGVLADRSMFLSGTGILQIFQIDKNEIFKRKNIITTILRNGNLVTVGRTLKNNEIDYILTSSEALLVSTTSAIFYDKVFTNNMVTIFKVKRNKIPANIFSPTASASSYMVFNL